MNFVNSKDVMRSYIQDLEQQMHRIKFMVKSYQQMTLGVGYEYYHGAYGEVFETAQERSLEVIAVWLSLQVFLILILPLKLMLALM
ncbi:hypothetical protein X975_00395, partial [Stegodyphus mimosarum]